MLIKTDRSEFLSYLEDTSNLKGNADALYIPEDKLEVCEILKEHNAKGIPITCSAAHTGTTGGCVPFEGTILSLEKLNTIENIDTKRKFARVEAGLPLNLLEGELAKFDLTFRPQPTESLAFIGAATSTGASGVRGFRYGSIRNYIQRLEIALADGSILDIKRGKIMANRRRLSFSLEKRKFEIFLPTYKMPQVKTQAGYFIHDDMDLLDLFIGSEGTLGVILSLEISVQKKSPVVFDGVVFFTSEIDGFKFVEEVIKLKKELSPTSIEFFDSNSLKFLKEDYHDIPQTGCAIYFEQETDLDSYEHLMDIWVKLLEENGADLNQVWMGDNPLERKRIYEFRHKLPEKINEFLRQYSQKKLSTDIAVPAKNFYKMYHLYKEEAQKLDIPYVNFGHIGERHLHFNFLPRNDKEYLTGKKAIERFVKYAVKIGGTVSAEHGIGKIKKDYLKIMYGKKHIKEMARLKSYFDPNFILGRDNIFDKDIFGEL